MLYDHIPNWSDERVCPLMERFSEMLMEQRVFKGNLWCHLIVNEGMDKRTGGTFEFTHGTVEGVPSTVHSVDVVSDRFHYGDGHMAKQVKEAVAG